MDSATTSKYVLRCSGLNMAQFSLWTIFSSLLLLRDDEVDENTVLVEVEMQLLCAVTVVGSGLIF